MEGNKVFGVPEGWAVWAFIIAVVAFWWGVVWLIVHELAAQAEMGLHAPSRLAIGAAVLLAYALIRVLRAN